MAQNNNSRPVGHAPVGMGSNPTAYRYKADDDDEEARLLPVPWWFNSTTAKLFHNLSMEDDDIVVSSGLKMGTTWLTNLLVSLLYEYDDDGNLIIEAVANREKIPGRLGQTYPDAMYPTRAEKEKDELGIYKRMPEGRKKLDRMFGNFVWEDILEQPRPRMIVSHLFGRKHLPSELFDDVDNSRGRPGVAGENIKRKGKGRLIVMVRNLKDGMCSFHNHLGTASDGWLGNEHGPGTFRRYVMLDDSPNAFGSAFHWVRDNSKAIEDIGRERVLVVHYESLILNFGAQLKRINAFLGLADLKEAKARAIEEACSFKSMESSQMRTKINCRKGGIGGWKDVDDLTDEHWAEFDRTFNKVLAGVKMAETMRSFEGDARDGDV